MTRGLLIALFILVEKHPTIRRIPITIRHFLLDSLKLRIRAAHL
jgi:hypothetical protein